MKKIFVTGCSGYLGGIISSHLHYLGYGVIGSSRKNIPELSKVLGHEVVYCDHLTGVPDLRDVDCLIHCATPNDVISRANDGGYPLAVNGVKRLIEHASHCDVNRIILLSTVQVYGQELIGTIDEMTPVCCNNDYALNHFFSEEVARLASKQSSIDIVCLRLPNIFGLPATSTVSRQTLVPFCFVDDLVTQGKITLRSSGLQTRNFLHVSQVSTVVEKLLDAFPSGFSLFNLSSTWYPTIAEIAEVCISVASEDFALKASIDLKSLHPSVSNKFLFKENAISPDCHPHAVKSLMRSTVSSLIMLQLNSL